MLVPNLPSLPTPLQQSLTKFPLYNEEPSLIYAGFNVNVKCPVSDYFINTAYNNSLIVSTFYDSKRANPIKAMTTDISSLNTGREMLVMLKRSATAKGLLINFCELRIRNDKEMRPDDDDEVSDFGEKLDATYHYDYYCTLLIGWDFILNKFYQLIFMQGFPPNTTRMEMSEDGKILLFVSRGKFAIMRTDDMKKSNNDGKYILSYSEIIRSIPVTASEQVFASKVIMKDNNYYIVDLGMGKRIVKIFDFNGNLIKEFKIVNDDTMYITYQGVVTKNGVIDFFTEKIIENAQYCLSVVSVPNLGARPHRNMHPNTIINNGFGTLYYSMAPGSTTFDVFLAGIQVGQSKVRYNYESPITRAIFGISDSTPVSDVLNRYAVNGLAFPFYNLGDGNILVYGSSFAFTQDFEFTNVAVLDDTYSNCIKILNILGENLNLSILSQSNSLVINNVTVANIVDRKLAENNIKNSPKLVYFISNYLSRRIPPAKSRDELLTMILNNL